MDAYLRNLAREVEETGGEDIRPLRRLVRGLQNAGDSSYLEWATRLPDIEGKAARLSLMLRDNGGWTVQEVTNYHSEETRPRRRVSLFFFMQRNNPEFEARQVCFTCGQDWQTCRHIVQDGAYTHRTLYPPHRVSKPRYVFGSGKAAYSPISARSWIRRNHPLSATAREFSLKIGVDVNPGGMVWYVEPPVCRWCGMESYRDYEGNLWECDCIQRMLCDCDRGIGHRTCGMRPCGCPRFIICEHVERHDENTLNERTDGPGVGVPRNAPTEFIRTTVERYFAMPPGDREQYLYTLQVVGLTHIANEIRSMDNDD